MTKPESALIAIVDDDAAARDAVASLVSAMGYRTIACEGAAAFLSSELRPTTACLISDVRMPGIGGLELYRSLADSGRMVPTILMTAYPDETTRAAALATGVHGYLAKPFDPETLLACIRQAVQAGTTIQKLSSTEPTE
ncbi:response regulator [Bosea sp. 124]|uniref:response regulator transcription factor n=1 Tax=Bosea sp. 124 TaxID=2135642 RepID=UPI0015E72061|nr:response regulator [Bosea sp. 124]